MDRQQKIDALRAQGVVIPAPETLEIGEEVPLERIRGPGTVLHQGTKLYGRDLLILPGARIGYEEPATLEDCAVGRDVQLGGGFFVKAVFLDKVVFGKGAHVRAGTLMEEESNAAHTVGLKQTILLPFVTLGSLINFCDVLMAGGGSRKDHSEVGSSFIHFNFTPFGRNGDKATPSLVGDVPRGVMMRSARIFLGGQGGLVGPVTIDYGTVLAAGFVYRLDHGPDQLVVGEPQISRTTSFDPRRYNRIRRKIERNLRYIGNLAALYHNYEQVRLPHASGDADRAALYSRACKLLDGAIDERIRRLGQVAGYMEDSVAELTRSGGKQVEIDAQRAFASEWPALEQHLRRYSELGAPESPELSRYRAALLAARERTDGSYIESVRALAEEEVAAGTDWLAGIVTRVAQEAAGTATPKQSLSTAGPGS